MNFDELGLKIQPCTMNMPFAFVSYSSRDKAYVDKTVIRLQSLGYNIWIDNNLKETDDSWKDGAFSAMSVMTCSLVMYFLSSSTLISTPCAEELEYSSSDEVRQKHRGEKLPVMIIEAEPVCDVGLLMNEVHNKIQSDLFTSYEIKDCQVISLERTSKIIDQNKIRIKHRDENPSYFSRIISNFEESNIKSFSDMFLNAVLNLFNSEKCSQDAECLKILNTYLPAVLMCAFIYENGICGNQDYSKAQEKMQYASDKFLKTDEWMSMGDFYKSEKMFAEAAVCYAAYGSVRKSPDSFLKAVKMWTKTGADKKLALICAKKAAALKSETGARIYKDLINMSDAEYMAVSATFKRKEG